MSVNLSSKYIKNTALEGTFSATQNLISFSIQEGMKVDLSECVVLVDLGIVDTDLNARNLPQFDGIAGVYRKQLVFLDDDDATRVLPNVAYVKNADIRCAKVGQVESLRRCDTLRLGLYVYENDLETKQGEQYLGGVSSDTIGGMNGSPFRDLMKSGTISSRNRNAQLRIPLRDIFDVAKTPVWDTNKYGRTDIKLEMNFDKLSIVQTMGRLDTNWVNADFDGGSQYCLFDVPASSPHAGAGATVTAWTTTKTYLHPEQNMPFHVGQKLVMEYTVNNGGATVYSFANGNYRERTITNIQHNLANDNKITITFADGIIFVQNDVVSAVSFRGADTDPANLSTITFNKVELEMKQVNDPTPPSIEYTTYTTTEDSGFSATDTNINKQYTMEGNADNMVVCACGIGAGAILKVNPTIDVNNSRITIDNKEETSERVVKVVAGGIAQADPQYYDRIDRTLLNMGADVECLKEMNLGFNKSLETNPSAPQYASALLNPLPVQASPKQVQLDLNYTAGLIRKLSIYKRMVKQI